MKEPLKMLIACVLILFGIHLLNSCATRDGKGVDVCANIKITGDKEVDDALYEKCQKEKIQGVRNVLGGYDKVKKKLIKEIKE